MKRWVVTLLKLVLVAGLMTWVLSTVHWQDRLVYRNHADEVLHEHSVAIKGPWNIEDVLVEEPSVPDGGPSLSRSYTVHRGPQSDNSELEIVPGLPTYWRNLHPWLFAAGAFCYFLTVLIAGTRWWWLLRVNGMDVRLPEALRLTWIGTFFNNVVPGQTGGDLIKALYIMKRCPGHRVPALVSVIVDRVLGLGSLAILAAVVVLFALDRFGLLAAAIWGVMALVFVIGTCAFSRRLRQAIKLKTLLEKLPHRLSNLLKLVDQAVFFYRGHKRVIAMSLLAGIGNHVISVLSVVLIGKALGVGMPWMEYFVLIPVISIVSALPIGPNGWGVGESLYQVLFAKYGAAYVTGTNSAAAAQAMGTRGVALSVLYRLHLTFWSLLGGLFVLFERDRVTRADIEQEVELEAHEEVPPPEPSAQ